MHSKLRLIESIDNDCPELRNISQTSNYKRLARDRCSQTSRSRPANQTYLNAMLFTRSHVQTISPHNYHTRRFVCLRIWWQAIHSACGKPRHRACASALQEGDSVKEAEEGEEEFGQA